MNTKEVDSILEKAAKQLGLMESKRSRRRLKESRFRGDLRSAVYNSLADICYEFNTPTQEELEKAIEWFLIHFYDEFSAGDE